MSWRRSFRVRLYVRDSLWALPLGVPYSALCSAQWMS